MSNPNPNLGLTCPSEGTFYVCEKAKVRFVGCCTTDPCADGSGECPQQDLRTSGFSSDHYDEIKPQSCVDTDPKKSWYVVCDFDALLLPRLQNLKTPPFFWGGGIQELLQPDEALSRQYIPNDH